jgi:hypothetical protein
MKVDFEINLKGLLFLGLTLAFLFGAYTGLSLGITSSVGLFNGSYDKRDSEAKAGGVLTSVGPILGGLVALVITYYLAKRTYRIFKA